MNPMKYLLSICLVLTLSLLGAQSATLDFLSKNYSELKIESQEKDKPILLYFHFDGCGACRKMEKEVFSDSKVIKYYNQKFLLKKLNSRKGEGLEVNKVYGIKMHPAFIFVDAKGAISHSVIGLMEPVEFIAEGDKALCSYDNNKTYDEEYKQGNSKPAFLIEYCHYLKKAKALTPKIVQEYLITQDTSSLYQQANFDFIYEYTIHNGTPYIDESSDAFQFLLKNPDLFYQHYNKRQVNHRIINVLQQATEVAITKNDEGEFFRLIKEIEPYDDGHVYMFQETDGTIGEILYSGNLIDNYKLDFYKHIGNEELYNSTFKEYMVKIWNNHEALNQFGQQCAKRKESAKYPKALKAIQQSIKLQSNYYNNHTYAELLYLSGKTTAATEQAYKAINIGRQQNRDTKPTSQLLIEMGN